MRYVHLAEAPHDRHLLVYRCVQAVGDHLFGAARFAGRMTYGPVVKFGKDGIREFDEVNTGDAWNLRQVRPINREQQIEIRLTVKTV